MVSLRCKIVVEQELKKLGIHCKRVDLGIVETEENLTFCQKQQFQKNLKRYGLELIYDRQNILIERIKTLIIKMIHYSDDYPKVKYSDYISEKLGYDYTYLANMFSEIEGMTIQQYIIDHKVERVKELLTYDDLNITEISYKLHYSSVAHLSNQFKKTTGHTPSYFRHLKNKRLRNLEDI